MTVPNKNQKIIWETKQNISTSNFQFDERGNQLAFIQKIATHGEQEQFKYELWFFKTGMDKVVRKIYDSTEGMPNGFQIFEGGVRFSTKGNWIFFDIQKKIDINKQSIQDAVNVDVWNYSDTVLQSEQLTNIIDRTFLAVTSASGNQLSDSKMILNRQNYWFRRLDYNF